MGCVATASHAVPCAAASSSGVPSTHAIDGATAGHVGDLPSCVGWVKRVDSRGVDREFYVVGTVHTTYGFIVLCMNPPPARGKTALCITTRSCPRYPFSIGFVPCFSMG